MTSLSQGCTGKPLRCLVRQKNSSERLILLPLVGVKPTVRKVGEKTGKHYSLQLGQEVAKATFKEARWVMEMGVLVWGEGNQ